MNKLWLKIIIVTLFVPTITFAAASNNGGLQNAFKIAQQTASGSYQTTATFESMLSSIILLILQILGLIFIFFIIFSGWLWMSAGGNEAKVTKARGILVQAVLGLLIVIGAYAISYFIIMVFDNQLLN